VLSVNEEREKVRWVIDDQIAFKKMDVGKWSKRSLASMVWE
jgi:hypothetical protein